MSSLKALAAAKSRRSSGEQHIVSGTRPGTSIGSHAAFAPQNQYRGGQPNMKQFQQQPQNIQQQQHIHQPQNGLPFSKLTVSDAIGLITLRLGKVEQYLIDVQADGGFANQGGETNLPPNTKLIDNSVLTSIVNRFDALEKREVSGGGGIQSQIADFSSKLEAVTKVERELKETKEMLVNLMFKHELFTKETNTKFNEHENAILEVSQQVQSQTDVEPLSTEIGETETYLESSVVLSDDPDAEKILSAELKNMIKQELSGEMESA
jgi:hypothetical protein